MEPKELVGLYEAYQQVYEPQELSEEVEIATEYFYEMGLNENGIDILIEELGEEEFVDWVYDIAEEYTLSEATQTRLQKMAAAKGKIVIGPKGSRPQSTTNAAIKKMGGTTKRISSSQRLGSTISGKRQKAASTAVSQQAPASSSTPTQTKKGIGGLIGSIVQRAKQDTELLKKSVQTAKDVASRRGAEVAAGYSALRAKGREAEQSAQATRARRKAKVAVGRASQTAGRTAIKAAGAAGAAAGEGVKAHRQGKTGAQIAGRAAGTFVRKMTKEEYEYILEHLIDEGYANTLENAEKIVMNMSEEWRNEIIDEAADNVIMTVKSPSGQERSKIRKGAWGPSDSHRHEKPEQIANRRFSQELADRKKEREERMRAGRLTVATKRGIERATNRSDRTDFTPDSSLRAHERDELPTDYRARRRRASGR